VDDLYLECLDSVSIVIFLYFIFSDTQVWLCVFWEWFSSIQRWSTNWTTGKINTSLAQPVISIFERL